MGPREIEDAIREAPILVFLDQAQADVAGVADAGHHVDRGRFFRIERDSTTDGDNRIEHRAFATGKRRSTVRPLLRAGTAHRLGIGGGAAAADELQTVRFVGHRSDVCSMHGHEMTHPW